MRPKFYDNTSQAIKNLAPGAEYVLTDGAIETWINPDISRPSISAINAEKARLDTEWEAKAYSEKRQAEYPDLGDQLDMIYKDMKNSTTTHADAVEAVKTKWPKNNSGPVE